MEAGQLRKLRALKKTPALIFLLNTITLLIPISLMAEVDPLYLRGNELFEKKQFDSAVTCFDSLTSILPGNKEVYYNRGLCFYKGHNYTAAISDFDKCLQIDSSFKQAEFIKALALQKKGDLKTAFTIFSKLHTTYNGYKVPQNLVRVYRASVILSTNWYYMLAIMFLVIILFAVVAKTYAYRKL